ncbi:hypothetical protein KKH07_02860 [Patescibacteria group bacterium]|nr:hypothetical protein [Patescibacteria group bacterium]MBU1563929.1 hypothetical protein [Patescibacteria group bacterium]MBU2068609.1 hypothetical protein [Patescibacteria group bacterium]
MNNTKNIFLVIIVAVICFIAGYMIYPVLKPALKSGDTFEAGWQAAKERLEQSDFNMPTDMEITSIYGKITKIEGDKITVAITPLSPLADPKLDTRIVTANENTKIYKLTPKSEEEMREEEIEIGPDEIPMSAEPYKREEISLSDLQVDQKISVFAAEDIKEKKEFTAESIQTEEVLSVSPELPESPELPK